MWVVADLARVQQNDIWRAVLLREMDLQLLNILYISVTGIAGLHAPKYRRRASALVDEMQHAKVVGRHPGWIGTGKQLAGKVLLRVAYFTECNGRKLSIAAGIAPLVLIWFIILLLPCLILTLPGPRWFSIPNPMDFAPGRRSLVIPLLSKMRQEQGAF